MRTALKITVVSSLLIIASLLISACGGGGVEQFVQGQGKVDIYVTDNNATTPLKLANVTIEVRETNAAGTLIATITNATDVNGFYQWVSPPTGVGSPYYFTFILAGYTTQSRIATPNLTGTNARLDIPLAP